MIQKNLLNELIAQARKEYPKANYGFLDNAIFSTALTTEDQQDYVQLLGFARSLQNENPLFESIYHHLVHLFVLNGSRLHLLKTIDRRLRGLVEGQNSLLLISGISGIGKTSLVMAFHERVHQLGAEFIPIHCFEQESTSYSLWQAVARSVSYTTGVSTETLLAPLGLGRDARSSQELKLSLADWLTNITTIKPLVILLDDLHWADADSLEVLNYLTSQELQIPILFIANYRMEETQSRYPLDDFLPKLRRNWKIDLIHLEPLTRSDIERLVTAFHGSCSPQLAKYLHDRAEGHPLFTVELLNDLVEQELLPRDRTGCLLAPEKSVPVPVFLKQLITKRASRLGKQVEQMLAISAVAGESWPLKIVEPMVDIPEEELLEAIDTSLRAEIITIEDENAEIYRFSHGLIREVLYTQQLARRRKRLHEQIAAQFEQQQPTNVFAIAYHYYEAEHWEKAVTFCLSAGEKAVLRFANYSALHWYQRALTGAEHMGKALTPGVLFAIYDRLGRTHIALDQREDAEIAYSRLRDVMQSVGDLTGEGHALANLANVRMRRYQLDLAERTAYEALRVGEHTGDLRLMTHIHASLGGLLIIRGQLDQATYHYDQLLQHTDLLSDSGTLLDALRFRAYHAIWIGQYSEAETYAHQALKLADKAADPIVIAGAYQNLGYAQIESGQYLEAHQNLRATLESIEVSGTHHHQKPRLLNLMGYLYLELGDAQEALIWDQKALDAIQETHIQSIEMLRYSLLNKATDYLHLGRLDEAQATVAQFETIKEGAEFVYFRYFNRYLLLICEMHLVQNAFEQAIELAQEARNLAQSKGVLKNIARSHWLEGQALAGLNRFEESLTHLEKAMEIVDGIQHGSLRWKIRLSLAAVGVRAGKSSQGVIWQARELIDQTIQSLSGSFLQEVFLASNWVKQLKELEQSPSLEKPAYPAGLTHREVEILQLVAKGATNQQVADILHISVRTVNTHMTNILNKTGLDNRTAASAYAIQHKLVPT